MQTTSAAVPQSTGAVAQAAGLMEGSKRMAVSSESQTIPQIRTLLDFAAWVVFAEVQKRSHQGSLGAFSFLAEDMPSLPEAVKRTKVMHYSALSDQCQTLTLRPDICTPSHASCNEDQVP